MAYESEPGVLVMHGLRLKGFGEPRAVAALYGLEPALVADELARLRDAGLAEYREGQITGWTLTLAGRADDERRLAAELEVAGHHDAVDDAYRRFLALNRSLLEVCTDWQVREIDGRQAVNDHSELDHDTRVLERLRRIHDELQPVLGDLSAAFRRFSGYAARFVAALERVAAGDAEWVAGPVIDSYHTVWFELHEDLLATLGRERAAEIQV